MLRLNATFLLVLALLTFAISADAARIHLKAARPGVTQPVHLVLYRVGADSSSRNWKAEATGGVPSTLDVALSAGTWQVEVQTDGLWAESSVVAADGDITIDVWPTGVVHGTFSKDAASVLRVAFQPDSPLRGPDGPAGQTNCVVDGVRWRCVLPAAAEPLQLRLMPAGSAPVFLWNRKVSPGKELDAGAIDVVPGASVAGSVTVAKKTDLTKIRVTLSPTGSGEERTPVTVSPSARGVFLFTGVTPGDYIVRAWTRELVATPTRVRVLPRLTAHLRDALVLDVPRRLTVAITPAVPPAGGKWLVELSANREGSAMRADIVNQGAAAGDGTWTSQGLPPGDYFVTVKSVDGSQWDSSEVTLTARNERLVVDVPIVHATGRVMLGEKPLAAKLTIWQRGRNLVQSNEDGTFEATLPGVATDPWHFEIESEKPAVTTVLRDVRGRVTDTGVAFDLVVSRTMISGRCVNAADQSPVGNAIIDLSDPEHRFFRQVFSRADGTFDAFGLPPGKYSVAAKDFLKQSETMEVTVGDEPVTDLVLALLPEVEFKGRLFAPNQSPIPHAKVYGWPRDAKGGTTLPETESDSLGGFDLILPPGTRMFDVVIAAPGFALSLARAQVSPGNVVPVYCDPSGGRIVIASKNSGDVWLHHGAAKWSAPHVARVSGGTFDQAAGQIRTGVVEAGPWSACIENKCANGYLAPGGDLTLTLD